MLVYNNGILYCVLLLQIKMGIWLFAKTQVHLGTNIDYFTIDL